MNLFYRWIKLNFSESFDKETLLAEFVQHIFFEFLKKKELKSALFLIRDQLKNFSHIETQKGTNMINIIFKHILVIKQLLSTCLYFDTQTPLNYAQISTNTLKDHFVSLYCKQQNIPKYDPIYVW